MALGNHNRAFATRVSMSGFGLIELVIVIAIVAILTVIALPSYTRTIQLNRVVTDSNDLLAALNLARNEAIARGRPVTVCASANGTTCDGPVTADWSGGYMIFTDFDPIGTVDAGVGDTVLRVVGPIATHDKVSASGNSGYINFTRMGTARFPSAATIEVKFLVSSNPCDNNRVRMISVTPFGRSGLLPDTCP
jgi:type IV fimbrial biogenesis protein FimT